MSDLKTIIRELAAELKPDVAAIEAGPELTQNRYDRYLAILAPLPGDNNKMISAIALIGAGANRDGVTAALAILNINLPK